MKPPLFGLALALLLVALPVEADPVLTSWSTTNASVLARVIQTTTATTGTQNTTPVNTWPTAGIANHNSGSLAQSTSAYADVQQIRYDTGHVYIVATGLPSYTMGPWLQTSTTLFGFWPVAQNYTVSITRAPTLAAVKTTHPGGVIGLMVNGVGIYDLGDAFGFVQTSAAPVAGSDSMGQTNATHPWWRDALAVEVVTFDPGFAHQPGLNGQYHYHAEPKALRYQLGDNMAATYDATNHTFTYTESTAGLHHSPILGWSFDGYPIYGPYGYTNPSDSTSGVSRLRSGFVLRNAANHTTYGVTDLTANGRTTLAKWAAVTEGLATLANYSSQTLSNGDYVLATSSLYGPATNYVNGTTTYSLGRYIGDYDFLGDRGQTQGPSGSFDLDQYNGRQCVTPEYPGGTYAYFVTNDTAGNPQFPYLLGKQFYGTRNGQTGATIPGTGVTTYFNAGGASLTESWSGSPSVNPGSGDVTLTWSSLEGGTYKVQRSSDLSTWTTLNAAVAAPSNTTLPAPATVITTTSITDSGAALPASNARRYYRVNRN